MVLIRMHGPQVHQKRLLPVESERRGRDERALETMCFFRPQSTPRRHICLAGHLKIDGEGIEVVLDFRWGSQSRENLSFWGSQNRFYPLGVHTVIIPALRKKQACTPIPEGLICLQLWSVSNSYGRDCGADRLCGMMLQTKVLGSFLHKSTSHV